MSFPKDFVWGAAASAFQIEGATTEDGRAPSIWDVHAQQPGRIFEGHTGDPACDHYHRWAEDVALLRYLGANAYRLSISWPRVIPLGTGESNAKGLAFYDRLIDAVEAVPGVDAASLAGDVPLEGTGGENLRTPSTGDQRLLVRFKRADSGYFKTIGLDLVAGRSFSSADRLGTPYVTVINEALAQDLASTFGMTDPVGHVVDLPALSFAIWTAANLIPRAVSHHAWYRRTFPDYPANRRAVIPALL